MTLNDLILTDQSRDHYQLTLSREQLHRHNYRRPWLDPIRIHEDDGNDSWFWRAVEPARELERDLVFFGSIGDPSRWASFPQVRNYTPTEEQMFRDIFTNPFTNPSTNQSPR